MNNLTPVTAVLERVIPAVTDNHIFFFRTSGDFGIDPGQFVEISLPGVGSFPVSSCDLVNDSIFSSCIRRSGQVTEALYRLEEKDVVGLRGPFGNGFSVEQFAGHDALLIAGGLGMAPLRALLNALLNDSERQGRIILLYGARSPGEFLFREELLELSKRGRIELRLSVDFAEEIPDISGRMVCKIGLVNELLADLDFVPRKTVAAVCGPPALYGCVLEELALLGVPATKIFATLERRMRCGIGECCHCVVDGLFICKEGPVFSLDRLRMMEGAI